ncbi:hypothetical protein TVAG_270090 [Trichomonas vaginalis G3]|uniref:Ral GTPase-activating protein subunit alpha/beta N-terminal domain-containing protein n=1 Tax=Trichomonas vaginalis (strain ATCC PRA-98 / G3) TaxID=412133 RepID=A2F9A1_TRIV3|nr:hypothetical protein TVAGG3_0321930 [Trichomonas vaginalis G3]EAX98524.1 hypothetical protein TVAG_270090 [Trichomonas vaginalis G3]KAI5529361.1 hypothetical protein TVAGG3_0321930 [Trichomonas vaginalis G3]|eukprot:XP_001311454.1 hypothetical protein [Trichomonas vaginalis G3]
MNELSPMMHYHLVGSGLFPDNSAKFVLSVFPADSCFNEIKKITTVVELNTTDKNSLKWLIHCAAFVIHYGMHCKTNEEHIVQPLMLYMIEFLSTNCIKQNVTANMDIKDFNAMTREILPILSMVCEPNAPKVARDSFRELINTIINSKFADYETETIELLFRMLLGICDSFITDLYSYKHWDNEIDQFLENLFEILMRTTKICPNNWKIFNEVTCKWPNNSKFQALWSRSFMVCFQVLAQSLWTKNFILVQIQPESLGIDLDSATEILIYFIDNARYLATSPNFGIVHNEFGFIADCISQNKENIIGLFNKKWFVDEIFEIFSLWPLAQGPSKHFSNEDKRKTSLFAFVMLLENGIIKNQSNWFQDTITYFKRELIAQDSSIAPVLLTKLSSLLVSHQNLTRELITPIMKCLLRQTSDETKNLSININDPLIENLILNIAEIYIHNTNQCGTINNIKKLQKRMYSKKVDIHSNDSDTWQNQMLILMLSGCHKAFASYVLRLLDENTDLPPEFFTFLSFVPVLMPTFLKHGADKKGTDFELNFVSKKNVYFIIKDFKSFHAFAICMQALYLEGSRFRPLSQEKTAFNKMLRENNLTDLITFLEFSGYPHSNSMDVETAKAIYQENKEFAKSFFIGNSVLTIIDNPKFQNLIMTIRSQYGVLNIEISDMTMQENVQSIPVLNDTPQTVGHDMNYSADGTFLDSEMLQKFNDLDKINVPISFKPYSSPGFKSNRIFSCLANLGVISTDNLHKIFPITNADVFISEYDQISPYETIEVAVLCYTKDSMSGYGSEFGTNDFISFLNELGEPQNYESDTCGSVHARIYTYCSIRVVYIALCCMKEPNIDKLLSLPVVLAYNETGFSPNYELFEKTLPSKLVFAVRTIKEEGQPENGAFAVLLICKPKGIVLPFMLKIARFVSKRNFKAMIAMISIIYHLTQNSNDVWEKRLKLFGDIVYQDDISLLTFQFDN